MKTKNILKNQSGQISKVLIIVAAAVLVIIVVIFGITRIVSVRKNNNQEKNNSPENTTEQEAPKPIYETQIGDLKFIFQSSADLGNFLPAKVSYEKDLTTTERFIKVTVAAQNKGKNNLAQNSWSLGNIIDQDGRNFTVYNQAYNWLPKPDLCGAVLKPEFEPIPCVRIYEVSKESTGLKIQVISSGQGVGKKQTALLDLDLD